MYTINIKTDKTKESYNLPGSLTQITGLLKNIFEYGKGGFIATDKGTVTLVSAKEYQETDIIEIIIKKIKN